MVLLTGACFLRIPPFIMSLYESYMYGSPDEFDNWEIGFSIELKRFFFEEKRFAVLGRDFDFISLGSFLL